MKFFITYGDSKFQKAKDKILREAAETGVFDTIIGHDSKSVSSELSQSAIFRIERGGGLWSWKPDIIWQTIQLGSDGDFIVYCDAGCTLSSTREWNWYWEKLKNYDIIAQKIFQRTDKWTRKELLDFFEGNGSEWKKCFQYQATIVLKISDFTRCFVKEWRDIMIQHPNLIMDVSPKELANQLPCFVENRHDQSVYSALIYKYLRDPHNCGKIYSCWERIEDYSALRTQAIRATRLRNGESESIMNKIKGQFKRIIKHAILIPFYYGPINLVRMQKL